MKVWSRGEPKGEGQMTAIGRFMALLGQIAKWVHYNGMSALPSKCEEPRRLMPTGNCRRTTSSVGHNWNQAAKPARRADFMGFDPS